VSVIEVIGIGALPLERVTVLATRAGFEQMET
jgi:hypothetical protein